MRPNPQIQPAANGPQRRVSAQLAAWSVAGLLPLLAACGGGSDSVDANADTPDAPQATHASPGASALAVQAPAAGTLRLASSTASGQARAGDVCATSADGNLVLFSSYVDNVVAGDSNFETDVFLKNLSTGAVKRVSSTGTGGPLLRGSTCLGMSPDGQFVAFQTTTAGTAAYQTPTSAGELAIFVKNTSTGALVRVTPPRTTLPTTDGFKFAGLSNDGTRVAFLALPTTTYLGAYNWVVNGPVRLLLGNLGNPAAVSLVNLEAPVRLAAGVSGGLSGDVQLSPDGQSVAFSTPSNYPELGDNNARFDVFLLDVASLAVRQINTDVAGNVVTFNGGNSSYGVQGFLGQGRRVALYIPGDSSAGPTGLYAKHLDTGALQPLLATAGLPISTSDFRLSVSLSDAGTAAAYVRRTGNTATGTNVPTLRNLLTGQEQNVATTASGVVGNGQTTTAALVAADGRSVVFANNAKNLVATNKGSELRVYAKTVAAPAGVQ